MSQLIGEWRYHADTRRAFAEGDLADRWLARYPEIFDERDLSLVRTQPRNHFYEWLAAVMMHEATGFLSLVEKYQFGRHKRKQSVMRKLMSEEVFNFVIKDPDKHQAPDLLVYAPDLSDWFFVEAKGPGDRLRPVQRQYFDELHRVTGRPWHVARFKELR